MISSDGDHVFCICYIKTWIHYLIVRVVAICLLQFLTTLGTLKQSDTVSSVSYGSYAFRRYIRSAGRGVVHLSFQEARHNCQPVSVPQAVSDKLVSADTGQWTHSTHPHHNLTPSHIQFQTTTNHLSQAFIHNWRMLPGFSCCPKTVWPNLARFS